MIKRTILALCLAATPLFVAAPAANAATATTSNACPGGHYPAAVAGAPTTAKVGMTGMAVWADRTGWHLRVSEAGPDRAVFTGTISTDGRLRSVRRHDERGDVKVDLGAHRVVYRFTNYGAVDGIDFVVPCSSYVRFAVALDRHALPASEIVVGHGNHHPAGNPFTLRKVA
jgi:hypothetical protein